MSDQHSTEHRRLALEVAKLRSAALPLGRKRERVDEACVQDDGQASRVAPAIGSAFRAKRQSSSPSSREDKRPSVA